MPAEDSNDVRFIEKALKVGLGLISLGEEKFSGLVKELAERGEKYAEREDSAISRFVDTFSEKGRAVKEKGTGLKERIARGIRGIPDKVSFATKADVEKLKAEIEKLKNRLG